MSEAPMNDPENADLSRAYAATARDEPAAALDDAILAKARRAAQSKPGAHSSSRHWSQWVAVAATLVVTASLVVLMDAEPPQVGALAPPARDGALAPAAPTPTEALQEVEVAPAIAAQKQEKPASSGKLDRAARDQPSEQHSREREHPASPAPPSDEVAKAAAPAAASNASGAALGERRSLQAAESVTRNLVDPGSAKKDESPEAWLVRIAELRKQGRSKEAEESLAEFRKRYPDYPIAAPARF
jgi:hypothetical protein